MRFLQNCTFQTFDMQNRNQWNQLVSHNHSKTTDINSEKKAHTLQVMGKNTCTEEPGRCYMQPNDCGSVHLPSRGQIKNDRMQKETAEHDIKACHFFHAFKTPYSAILAPTRTKGYTWSFILKVLYCCVLYENSSSCYSAIFISNIFCCLLLRCKSLSQMYSLLHIQFWL